MNVTSFLLVHYKLQDRGHDGDDGWAEDGDRVVQVVPGHLNVTDIVNLPESKPDFNTERGQPEEG